MTISSNLFLHFILLCFIDVCLSSNQHTMVVQSPEDNEGKTGKMQMEGLSFNSEGETVRSQEENNENDEETEDPSDDSEIVIVQSDDDNNGKTGKLQREDHSINPGNVKIQIQEENKVQKVQIVKMQMEDISTRLESLKVKSQEEDNRRTGKMQMEDSFIKPESVVIPSQVDNNQRFGRIQTGNTWQPERFIVRRVFYDPSSRLYLVCNATNACRRATYDEMLYLIQNNPESVNVRNLVDNNQKPGTMQTGDILHEESFKVHSVFYDPSSRLYIVCNQTRFCIRATEEEISGIIPNVTPAPNTGRSSITPQAFARRPTEDKVSNRGTYRESMSQMSPNKVNGNNSGKNLPPAITEGRGKFQGRNPEDAATVPQSERPQLDENFFSGFVNNFAFKLVENLNLESNFVISPLSIFVALSMCYLGSDGKTKAQMEQAFGLKDYGVSEEQLHEGIKNLLSLMLKGTTGYEVFVANGMFLGNNFTADAQFEEKIKSYYNAEIKNLDFRSSDSLKFINEWVAKSTRNMITSIINRSPDIMTRLILLNAVFFKGVWKMQFPPSKTYTGKFRTLDRKEKQAQFMRLLDETFPIFRSDQHRHTFIKMPYAGEQVSMIIALPFLKAQNPMPKVTDAILYNDVLENLEEIELGTVAIPKFRLEYQTNLKRPLQDLGIKDIFEASVADLSKLRKENDLYLSKITHKAVIDVDEVGTTASAITSDFVGLVYKNKTNFVADHPFAFYIVHETTGLVLFYGKVFDVGSEPSDSNDRTENVPAKARPTEGNGSNNRKVYPSYKPRPAGESASNDRRESDRFGPRPAGEKDSNDRRESDRFGPRPAGEKDSNDRRESDRFGPRPAGEKDSNDRFGPRPAGEKDSNDRRESDRFDPRPAGEKDSNDRFGPRPAEEKDSNDGKENERHGPRPEEDSYPNDEGINPNFRPGTAGAVVPNEQRRTTLINPRPTQARGSSNRGGNSGYRIRPTQASDYRRANPGSVANGRYDSRNPETNYPRIQRPAGSEYDMGI